MRKYFSFLAFIIIACSCNKSNLQLPVNTPACVKAAIEQAANNPEGISEVDEYIYHDKVVFLFRPSLYLYVNSPNEVKDDQCNTICSFGNYSNLAMRLCNGEDFSQKAILQRVIWKR